jgi:hypothetical protein
MLWRNVIASKSYYHSGRKEAIMAAEIYRSGNIYAVIASISYCFDS